MLPSRWLLLGLILLATFASLASAERWQLVDDASIEERLRDYVDEHRLAPGVVVGVWERDAPAERRQRFFVHGRSGRPGVDLGPETLFELGSITKGLTGLLLADWSLRTGRPLETPLNALLGAKNAPSDADEPITLLHLATHRSGLPRLPGGPTVLLPMLFSRDPYAGSTPDDVFAAAAGSRRAAPGERFTYSNLGYAVLGQALALDAGQSYEHLLRNRILDPSSLSDAWLSPAAAPPARLARGFGSNFRPVPHWHLDGYAPAGGLISDARTLLGFLAQMAEAPSPAWQLATQVHHARDDVGQRAIGLGWMRRTQQAGTLIWHNGGTGGFRTFGGVVPEAGIAIVVLTNGRGNVDPLALSLIDPERSPPSAPPLPWFGFLLAGFGIVLAPGLAWLTTRPAPTGPTKRRPLDRVDVLSIFIGAALLLTVSGRHGTWQWVPFALWWLGALLTLAAVPFAARGWSARPWLTGSRWSRTIRLLQFVFFALATLAVLG